MDNVSKNKRSHIMAKVKSKNTAIEILFRKKLLQAEINFKKNITSYIGKPDIVLKKDRIVVFIDSCFWHGCYYHCRMPHTNRAYWNAKIQGNKERDKKVNSWYKKHDWIILRFWEHSLRKDLEKCVEKVINLIGSKSHNRFSDRISRFKH